MSSNGISDDTNLRAELFDVFSHAAQDMRQHAILTDVTLLCEGTEFPVHRVILAAGSPYFRTMFTGDMLEASSPVVEIQGVTSEAMTYIVQFLYFRKMEKLRDMSALKSLITASHMLQVQQLHQLCCKEYWKNLSVDYFNEMWAIAELFDHVDVSNSIMTFLIKHFSVVINRKEFLSLDVARLEKLTIACKSSARFPVDLLMTGILLWYKHNRLEQYAEDNFLKLLNTLEVRCLSTDFLSALCNEEILKNSARVLNLLLAAATSRLCFNVKNSMVDISKQIYFFGNIEGHGTADYSAVQSFHYVRKEWSLTVQLPFQIRDDSAIVHYNEYVYFIGGRRKTSTRPTPKVERFGLLVTSMARSITSMQEARCNAGAVAYDNKIYVIGGSDAGMTTFLNMDLSRMMEIYDIRADTWTRGSSTRYFYNNPQAVLLNDTIYVLNSNTCSSIECYNPTTDQWSVIGSHTTLLPAGDTWVAPCQGKLYTFHLQQKLNVLVYDSISGKWETEDGKIHPKVRNVWSVSNYHCVLPFIFVLDCHNHLHKYEPQSKFWQTCGCLNPSMTLIQGVITG